MFDNASKGINNLLRKRGDAIMKLIIVESPTKCQTIGKYLGDEYKVVASLGHVRDLATSGKGGLGIDVDHDFKATYSIQPKQIKTVKSLQKEAKAADEVILATDPDREGEAIAWHLADLLGLEPTETKRLEFHEITRQAVNHALENPRHIDLNLVASQETRRILDRIIGFKLSNLLQKKIKSRSAGRVQSTSLKLLVDHEKEVAAFIPEEYWSIDATIKAEKELKLELHSVDGKTMKIRSEAEASAILTKIPQTLDLIKINKEVHPRESKAPLTTSTLQQEAFNAYKFSTRKTSLVAQKLYEGITLAEGPVGLITYMRTDSTRLSPQFVDKAKQYIVETYGEKYLGTVKTGKKVANMQDAHEAIRPTSLEYTPESIKKHLSADEYKIYSLIYKRALASLMSAKIEEVTTAFFEGNGVCLKKDGITVLFDGHAVLKTVSEEKREILPALKEGKKYDVLEKNQEQHFTKAPAHYSEAKLVKLMEELGIGRPSTYASTIEILKERRYVTSDSGILIPTDQGNLTAEILENYFLELIEPSFTAKMEEDLDTIVAGSESRQELLREFYEKFETLLTEAKEKMPKKPDEVTGEICPECGAPMVFKNSKYGKFEACSNYPTCKYIKKEEKPEIPADAPLCPDCGKPLVQRKNRRGETFYGCSGFPKCRYIKGEERKEPEPVVVVKQCPDCGGDLIIKRGKYGNFIGCSNYPTCRHMEKIEKEVKTEKSE